MSLKFHPRLGAVLICDFDTGFKVPEMVKQRPVVVISPPPRRINPLRIVVPLSTTAPHSSGPLYHQMDPRSLPGQLSLKKTWAKCDMLYTVSLERLDRIMVGKKASGRPIFAAEPVTDEDLEAIRRGVMAALGMSRIY